MIFGGDVLILKLFMNMFFRNFLKNLLPYGFVKKRQHTLNLQFGEPPTLYNEYGEKVKFFYFQAAGSAHLPYCCTTGRVPRNILWDRYNYTLTSHVYAGMDIFNIKGNPTEKYAWLGETEVIVPEVYRRVRENKEFMKSFKYIFTHNADLLETMPNARFMPGNGVWYGTKFWGGTEGTTKDKEISIVASNKCQVPFHILRRDIALHFLHTPNVDVYGSVVNYYASCAEIFDRYRYSIVIENNIQPYYFTEKILNCFASRTIPIYIGASKIGDFFNLDGIVVVEDYSVKGVEEAIKCCSDEYYQRKKEAIEDNYQRVQGYLCQEDYISVHYPDILI